MASDVIMVWRDWADEPPPPRGQLFANREPTYADFMSRHWEQSHDGTFAPVTLPAKPTGILPPLYAHVNHGRWLVLCDCSGSLAPAQPGEDFLCHRCEVWHRVEFPELKSIIDRQLLALPGHRHRAPERNWRP